MARNDLITLQRGNNGYRSLLRTPGLVACYLPWLQVAQGTTGQTLIDYSPQGNHAQLGSTPGEDTNDPSWGTNALLHVADDIWLTPNLGFNLNGQYTAYFVGIGAGIGTIFSLASLAANYFTRMYLYPETNSARLQIYDATNTRTAQIDGVNLPLVNTYRVRQTATLCDLNVLNIGKGASVTANNSSNNARFGVGCIVRSALDFKHDEALTSYAVVILNRASTDAEDIRIYANLKTLLAGQGVTLA